MKFIINARGAMDPFLGPLLHAVTPLLCMFAVITASVSKIEDFEGIIKDWETDKASNISVMMAEDVQKPGHPVVDTTVGTEKGRYLYIQFKTQLYSKCHESPGPNCRLNFNAVISRSATLSVFTTALCECWPIPTEAHRHLRDVNATGPGWKNFDIPLGINDIPFEVILVATTKNSDDFIALDDLGLVDCEPGPRFTCPEDRPFQCLGTRQCLSRDRVCDLHTDCPCDYDEREEICDMVLPEGQLRLDECDFPTGKCLWYNINSQKPGLDSFAWEPMEDDITVQTIDWRQTFLNNSVDTTVEHLPKARFLQVNIRKKWRDQVATLRSVSFEAVFNKLCQARFWYRIRDTANSAVIILELVELKKGAVAKPVSVKLWDSRGEEDHVTQGSKGWRRAVVEFREPLNGSFVLQFKTFSNNLKSFGDVALNNITLGLDCFDSVLNPSTCGNSGSQGPKQQDCDSHYKGFKIEVMDTGDFQGVQKWVVPESTLYRIQAFGSGGGRGYGKHPNSGRGSKVDAKFFFNKGEEIYFVVGQQGENDCRALKPSCHSGDHDNFVGGGGGGGATIIFKLDNGSKPLALLVAGGGGGGSGGEESSSDEDETTGVALGKRYPTSVIQMSKEEAQQLLESTFEGELPCGGGFYKGASGGFGLGGGACNSGGYGGGAKVVNLGEFSKGDKRGEPGRSYVDPAYHHANITPGVQVRHGFVEITFSKSCPCADYCMWLDDDFDVPACLCLRNDSSNGLECQGSHLEMKDTSDNKNYFLVALLSGVFTVVICSCCILLCIKRRKMITRHPTSVKMVASFFCPCIHFNSQPPALGGHVLPQIQRPPAVMHVNPNYDRIDTSNPEQSLKEISRKHLKLMSELGQGAFGEVYYGLLSNVPMVEGDLPVAVKTLPPVCTDQTEMDFLMEAVIVSKFNHPNIVKFIGVCFDQRPHYLVLELLEGGDLKTFLLQARPKWEQPSPLTVLDLLRLSLDIARGCQHLEEKHFIHRDIAARNCLLTTKGPNRTAKIADFGMARDIYRSDYYKKAGKAMLPVKWMPPEAFLDGVFSSKTDVWSFGILMWEVFSLGHMPYPGCSNEEVMNLVAQGGRLESPGGCPSAVFDIMASCWNVLPEGRPNFSLIISSLERRLQDDDLATRGLPVFYVAPIVNTRGPRLQDRAPGSPHPRSVTSRGVIHPTENILSPNTAGDGYLEPLLTFSSRGVYNDGLHQTSDKHLSKPGNKKLHSPINIGDGDNVRTAVKSRTPRVFYRANNINSFADSASESLLNSLPCPDGTGATQPEIQGKQTSEPDQNLEVRIVKNGCDNELNDTEENGNELLDYDDLKMANRVALPEKNPKRKSYTNFPGHSSKK
ncbi:unnamed protein product [Lymnaea stagnalis]|uniref:receptor protein-tyrosine kinase n=1 Tax=Lymnaea stagnalis TaxID=6523 RepID=A0AAV2IJ60_LYMST